MKNKTKTFAVSAVLMGLIILSSKALGLVRDILIAGAYGTTEAGIAYETASKLPVTIFDFVLGGVVTSAFIPVYNSIAVKKNKAEAMRFAQSYLNLILVITSLLSVIGVTFAPLLVRLIAPGLTSSASQLASSLTRIMFPMVIFVGLAFSFVGFLQSEGEYNIPAVISLVSNLIMTGYLILLNSRLGVYGLSFAMLIGWAAQAFVQLPAVRKKGFRADLRAPIKTPETIRAAKNSLPILIATWTTPVCSLINTNAASGIENGRAITALGYANRLYIIIVGLFSFVATNLLFPYFSRAAASGNRDESDRLTRTSINILTLIIAPISVGVAVLAEPFVTIIYERGTFTSSDTALTAEALRFYAFGMLFAAIGEVLSKAFFAEEKMKVPMTASVIAMVLNIIAVLSLRDVLTVGSIALITACSAAVSMCVNLIAAIRTGIISPSASDITDTVKSVLSALIMGAAVHAAYSALSRSTGVIISFCASVMCGVAVYGAITGAYYLVMFKTKKKVQTTNNGETRK